MDSNLKTTLTKFRQANDNRYAKPDGNYPTLTAGLADNFTPYSEDSGAEQENPFISNGTGTNNNTEIVTVGDYALFKEKQGNTLVVNQQLNRNNFPATQTINGITFTKNSDNSYTLNGTASDVAILVLATFPSNHFTNGHKYLIISGLNQIGSSSTFELMFLRFLGTGTNANVYNYSGVYTYTPPTDNVVILQMVVRNGTTVNNLQINPYVIDLTQMFNGNSDIIDDITANTSHFSWHYNGSLAYNTGSLENANGVKLVSTGRNIYNPNATYNVVIPNKPFFASKTTTITYYDKDKNSIGTESVSAGNTFTTPSNCVFISSSVSAITITPYYTDQEGGEGYLDNNVPIEYPYEEPYEVDTGSEVLRKAGSVKDYKEPNGTIHRLANSYTFTGDEMWYVESGYAYTTISSGLGGKSKSTNIIGNTNEIESYKIGNNTDALVIYLDTTTYDTSGKINTLTQGKTIYYELATPTTEQGTPFAENLPINDYGMLYWLDENDNLVGIPQGAKIFYSTNYKGFVDDMYSRVDGDSSAYVVQEELTAEETARSNQDTILQNAIGGTLRQLLCVKESLDFDNTDFVDLGTLDWYRINETSNDGFIYATQGIINTIKKGTGKILCTRFENNSNMSPTSTGEYGIMNHWTGTIYAGFSGFTGTSAEFKSLMKGVLLAYEKASS